MSREINFLKKLLISSTAATLWKLFTWFH